MTSEPRGQTGPVPTIDAAMLDLADTPTEHDLIKDIVAARLFGGLQPPPTIGRFSVRDLIGAGGMGTVYAAHDPELDRAVAIKVVRNTPDSFEPPAAARARLLREARVLARLAHPHVVTIHEVGVHREQVFIVMEHVEGRTLGEWVTAQHRPWAEIVEMYARAGEGLAAAHALGVVHRDFKPANVLVGGDGRPRVVDFGLARPVDPRARGNSLDYSITATGRVCGTPGYMAPELLTGAKASPKTDLYGYCVALMEALSGDVNDDAEGPPASLTEVPGEVIDILLRGLASDPEIRWPAMDPLLEALRRAAAQNRAAPREQRSTALITAGLAVALVVMVGLDQLGVLSLFTPGRVLFVDGAMLGIGLGIGLVTTTQPRRLGAFAWVLAGCGVWHSLNDATGLVLDRSLHHTMVSTIIGAALIHGLGAALAQRWLAWGALGLLVGAALMVIAPTQFVVWLALGYLISFASSVVARRCTPTVG